MGKNRRRNGSGRCYLPDIVLNASITGFTDGFLAKFEVECENCTDGRTGFTVSAERLGVDRSVVIEVRRAAIRNGLK